MVSVLAKLRTTLTTALTRWGGILLRPKQTLAAIAAGTLATGGDGLGLTLAYLLGCQVENLTEAIARWRAFDSLLVLVNGLAWALLTPILVGLLLEGLIGSARGRVRHLSLAPLVLLATLGNLLRQQGVHLPGPVYLPEILATLWGAGLAMWMRRELPDDDAAAKLEQSNGGERPATSKASGRPQMLAGALLLAFTAVVGARDLGIGIDNWDSYGPVGVDDPLPEFQVPLDDGSPLASADLQGQVSMLTFWATWCTACSLEMPTVAAVEERFAGTDLHIYGVNRDEGSGQARTELVEAYLRDKGIGFPQIYDDGRMARAFGVQAIPHMVLVDRRGHVRYVHMGQVGERTLANEIEELLAESD